MHMASHADLVSVNKKTLNTSEKSTKIATVFIPIVSKQLLWFELKNISLTACSSVTEGSLLTVIK